MHQSNPILWSLILLIYVVISCDNSHNIDYDYSRVVGDYDARIICDNRNCNSPTIVSVSQVDGNKFYFIIKDQAFSDIPEIYFNLEPFNIIESYFTKWEAKIVLDDSHEYTNLDSPYLAEEAYLNYWDSPDGDGSQIILILRYLDQGLVKTIWIEGLKDD
jgi:hypothetical protein